eukprot:COSAG02_NODE_9354_length_2246_cov_3.238472_1_plen_212_part_00
MHSTAAEIPFRAACLPSSTYCLEGLSLSVKMSCRALCLLMLVASASIMGAQAYLVCRRAGLPWAPRRRCKFVLPDHSLLQSKWLRQKNVTCAKRYEAWPGISSGAHHVRLTWSGTAGCRGRPQVRVQKCGACLALHSNIVVAPLGGCSLDSLCNRGKKSPKGIYREEARGARAVAASGASGFPPGMISHLSACVCSPTANFRKRKPRTSGQ